MRKIFCLVSAAVIALGLASCSKEPVETADRQITIVANTESGVDTKTYLSGDDSKGYKVLWREGDEIVLLNGNEFILSDGAGTTRGQFVRSSGFFEIENGLTSAYYATDGRTLRSTQQYVAENVITSAPMWCVFSVSDGVLPELEFKNLCGLLRLRLKGSGTVKEIKVSADQYLSGEFSIPDGCTATITNGSTNYVTLDCGDGVDLTEEGADFYISLPPGDYTGVKIEIKDFLGKTVTKTMKSTSKLNIARAQITPVTLNVTGLEPNIPGALAGVFTVNDEGKKVRFSKGNMYWDGDSFEFEQCQSDCHTSWYQNHVNHFYWSWDAEEACARENNVEESYNGIFTNDDLDHSKARWDLTVNGVTKKYRVLTYFEWKYLFDKHSHEWVTVNGIPGYVIAPDGVKLGNKSSYTNEELSTGNLVFLPVTGIREKGNISYQEFGYYWTSSMNQNNEGGYMYLTSDDVDQGATLNYGCCIRLVVDVD